uniref:Protein teflon n=1 Tax=Zeugodacus cucurbitae TaxID=28588 RepID=A0A0A1WRW0_ZEUCU
MLGVRWTLLKKNTKDTKNNKVSLNNSSNENRCIERHEKNVAVAPKTKQKLPLKQYLESKKFLLQSDDETKNCENRIKKNTVNETKHAISDVLVLKTETNKTHINQEKLYNLLNNEDIECGRTSVEAQVSNTTKLNSKDMCIEIDCNNIFTATDDLSLTDITNIEEEKTDKVNNICNSEKEINNIKSNVLELQITDEKHCGFQYEASKIYDSNGYQNEYINYNRISDNSSAVDEKTSQQSNSTEEMEIDKPLDLSFNKSDEWCDLQLEDISELLLTNGKDTMELVAEDFDKLVAQQTPNAFTDNPTSLFNSEHLQLTDIIADNLLPPFSKFFQNNANTLKNANNCIAQSTPKEKRLKASDATSRSVKNLYSNEFIATETAQNVNENVENVIREQKMSVFSKNLQCRFKVLKRVASCNDKKSKKRKQEVENVEEIIKESRTSMKQNIEILSVDVILPSDNRTHSESTTFTSGGAVLPAVGIPKTKDSDDLQIQDVRQEINQSDNWGAESIIKDLIPYVKIKKPTILEVDLCSHAAADSTSEQQQLPLALMNEIDYTPDDTLNQLKLNAIGDEKLDFNTTMESCLNVTMPCDSQNNTADDSIISTASEEEQENYTLLCSVGLKIIMDPNAEDELNLERLEEMHAKANAFSKIFAEFKYLWKVGKGIKSYEQLELDFIRLMQRLNEHYKFEMTISQTKRIVNLLSLWYMQTYHKWFIDKKRVTNALQHYLQTFAFLPKTTRRIFYCEECPRYFLAQQKYFAHRQGHSVLMPTCANCQSNFANRKELQLHAKVCATFKCVECAFKFENAANLEYHMRNKHIVQCEKCGKLCASAAELDWHEHQYPIICGLCNRLFDAADLLQKHRQESFHWDYTCRPCDIFLPTATLMKQHLRLCMGNTM